MQDPRTGEFSPVVGLPRDPFKRNEVVEGLKGRGKAIIHVGMDLSIGKGTYQITGINQKIVTCRVVVDDPENVPGNQVFVANGHFEIQTKGERFLTLRGLPSTQIKVEKAATLKKEIKTLEKLIEEKGLIPVTKQDTLD